MTVMSTIDGRRVYFDGLCWRYKSGERIENFPCDGTLCQGCGTVFRVDVQVADDLWERIKPPEKPPGAGMLCGRCIIERLERLGYTAVELTPLPPRGLRRLARLILYRLRLRRWP